MRTLPTGMIQVLAPFAPLFSERVFEHVRVLLVGAMLAPGGRTVSSAREPRRKTWITRLTRAGPMRAATPLRR
jgi:hypothetical protein